MKKERVMKISLFNSIRLLVITVFMLFSFSSCSDTVEMEGNGNLGFHSNSIYGEWTLHSWPHNDFWPLIIDELGLGNSSEYAYHYGRMMTLLPDTKVLYISNNEYFTISGYRYRGTQTEIIRFTKESVDGFNLVNRIPGNIPIRYAPYHITRNRHLSTFHVENNMLIERIYGVLSVEYHSFRDFDFTPDGAQEFNFLQNPFIVTWVRR